MDTTWFADMAPFLLLVTQGVEANGDLDTVPFAHEDYWTDRVGDLKEVTR